MDPKIIALLKEGQLFAAEGQWNAALSKWNEAIEQSALDAEITSFVATLLAEAGKIEEALLAIQQLATRDPHKAAAVAAQTGLDRWEKRRDVIGAIQLSGLSLKIARSNDNVEQLAFTSGNLGNILSADGSLESSLIHYDNAAQYYRQIGDTEWRSMMLSSAGGVLKDLERFDEAKEKLDEAVGIAEQHGHAYALTLGLLNLGALYGGLRQFGQSGEYHLTAVRIAWANQLADYFRQCAGNLSLDLRNLGSTGMEEAEELAALAIAAYRQKRYDWAIMGLKYAALLVDGKQSPIGLADIYHTLSNIEFSVNEMESAVFHLREACKLAREAQDDANLAKYSAGLSHLFLEQGKLPEAAQACDEAIACATRAQDYDSLATALGNRGIVALKQDQLNLAATLLRRQYQLSKEKGLMKLCANAANSLGAVYETLGDLTAAEKWFRISIEASENFRWPAGLHSLINMAILQRRRGAFEEAVSTYHDVLIEAIGKEDSELLFEAVLNLGILYDKTGQPDKSEAYFEQAKDWTKDGRDPRKKARLDMNEAIVDRRKGKNEEALEKFTGAYAFFKDSDWENAARCAVEAAALMMESGRLEEAMAQILPAAEQFERRMEKLSDIDAWRIHRDEELCFRVLMELTLQMQGPELALLACERSRGRAFRLALRRREAGHRTKAFDYMQILRQTALEAVLSGQTKGLEKEYIDRFVQVLSGAKDPYEAGLEVSWIKGWADKLDSTFVVYALSYPDKLCAWVITGRNIHFSPVDLEAAGGLAGLEKQIAVLRKDLGIPERGAGAIRPAQKKDPRGQLQKLYALLIDPLKKWLPDQKGARVCFVPWGPLFEIPFCALADDQGRYLVDRYAAFIIPTLHFFSSQREKNGSGFLVVGDPIPTQDSSFGQLPRLPYAEEEAREVAKLYKTQPLIGAEAGKKAVLDRLPGAASAHFAAHGLFDEIYPLRSAVALTAADEDNGLLYAADLQKMNLSSRLIVLSSCSSALGNISGDGVLGLCREFLAAGTDSIVASIWAVGDRSSAFHMTHFHRALREKPAAEALREAQLATKRAFEDVSQWAAYALWGWPEWDGRRMENE